ncbi:MAG: arsenic metallochaperone ArsD family protein [Actinomycetota bacterium]
MARRWSTPRESGLCEHRSRHGQSPQADPALVAFAADLKWVAEQGIAVQRYNLGTE